MIYLGEKKRSELPKEFISRNVALEYFDISTLKPMLPLIEEADLKYFTIVNGAMSIYFNIHEVKLWGANHGYDFWQASEISGDWREYIKTLDRLYKNVARLKELAERMEFDGDELTAIPCIYHRDLLWEPKRLRFPGPRVRENASPKQESENTVSLKIHKTIRENYNRLRKELSIFASTIAKTQASENQFGHMPEALNVLSALNVPIEAIHGHSIAANKTVVCGIYFLIREEKIVYVGQSIDIVTRVHYHLNHSPYIFERFSMIPVREENLDEVETWYIRHFRPQYNKTLYGGSLPHKAVLA